MQQGNGQFVLPYTAQQVSASSGEMHIQDMGELSWSCAELFLCSALAHCCIMRSTECSGDVYTYSSPLTPS